MLLSGCRGKMRQTAVRSHHVSRACSQGLVLPGPGSGVVLTRADVTQYMGLPEALSGRCASCKPLVLNQSGVRPCFILSLSRPG